MNILAWDIEASSLNADYGIVLCAGFKTVGRGKPEVIDVHQYTGRSRDVIAAERRLLTEMTSRLLGADVWLTHYGSRGCFDLNFVQSRLLYHRLPILPSKHPQIDTRRVAKNDLRLHSNRLSALQDFLNVRSEKNAIKGEQWIRALSGEREAMDYIVEHCRRDVLVLEQVYQVLRPLITDHPNWSLASLSGQGSKGTGPLACFCCGSTRLQSRGHYLTRTRKYRRFQCQECGAWSKEAKCVDKASVS